MIRKAVLLVALLSGGVCAAGTDDIEILDPRVRAVPSVLPNSAGFMTLTNRDSVEHILVAVHGEVADAIELHEHQHENGVMRMRPVLHIHLPPGEPIVLEPGGLHLMLIGLRQELKEGGSVDLTLEFDDGSRRQIKAAVVAISPAKH